MSVAKITIIIPCYNQAHLLSQSVQSCLDQTYPNVEIIVVDDGSPDDVEASAKIFGSKVRLIKQENKGLSAARNAGIAVAKGEYIKFLDSDDWLLPDCIEQQYHSISGSNKTLSVIGYSLHYEDQQQPNEAVYPMFDRFCHALAYKNIAPIHSYLFRTQDIVRIGGFNTGSIVDGGHEDYDLACRLAIEGYEAISVHRIGCVYRLTSNSMSRQVDQMRRTRKKVWTKYTHKLSIQTTSPEILGHLLGGFSLRIKSKDIGYESTDLLIKIADKLSLMASEMRISNATALIICKELSNLLNCLPRPRSGFERKQRKLYLHASKVLTDIALRNIKIERVLGTSLLKKLLEFAIAHMRRGNASQSRQIIEVAKTLLSHNSLLTIALLVYKLNSYIFPGPFAAASCKCMNNIYEIFTNN